VFVADLAKHVVMSTALPGCRTIATVAIDDTRSRIAAACRNGRVAVWSTNGALLHRFRARTGGTTIYSAIIPLVFAPGGDRLYVGGPELRTIRIPAPAYRDDPPAVHGMLVVGSKAVFASHLPMFHEPHDYQVIIELELPAAALASYRADKKQHPTSIYTLAPKPFQLRRIRTDKRFRFRGTLYRGHFERGGKPLLRDIELTVARVIHFRHLSADTVEPRAYRAVRFGSGTEQFLAHFVGQKPDFDQIAAITSTSAKAPAVITALRRPNTPLRAGDKLRAISIANTTPTELTVTRLIYTESGELSR
jgi:hypothetical protein